MADCAFSIDNAPMGCCLTLSGKRQTTIPLPWQSGRGRQPRLRLARFGFLIEWIIVRSGDQDGDKADLVTLFGVELYVRFFENKNILWTTDEEALSSGSPDVIISYRELQSQSDYRKVLRDLFSQARVGGVIVIVVPHAFLFNRQLALPSRSHPRQRRLYTPGSLMAEIEEALPPNDYRVRWAGDLDQEVDYGDLVTPAVAVGDVGLILERIAPPSWQVAADQADGPGLAVAACFDFEPRHTRVETTMRVAPRRILALKLDHIGDFLLGLPTLESLRSHFPNAAIDLAVGSWNLDMARALGVADRVIGFDAFPRNSSEEEPNVEATVGQFRALFTGHYDLAIDLRVDVDTRTLLRAVNATVKAAIGSRARFPFLDIHLPLDHTRNDAEKVRDQRIPHNDFVLQGSGVRRHFALHSDKDNVERDCAVVWGPFLKLDPGDYIFDFYIDLDGARGAGMLRLDVALDQGAPVSEMIVTGAANFHLPFRVERPGSVFEARIWTVDQQPSISFSFYGGRLVKRAPADVLHQSEYPLLLVELTALRMNRLGLAVAAAAA